MRTVRDGDGTSYVVVQSSGDEWLVRNTTTGSHRYVAKDRLSPAETPPLAAAAADVAVPDEHQWEVHMTDQRLGLLVVLRERGPLAVRTILAESELCESDVHGLTGELAAANLIEETSVGGERAYTLSQKGRTVLPMDSTDG